MSGEAGGPRASAHTPPAPGRPEPRPPGRRFGLARALRAILLPPGPKRVLAGSVFAVTVGGGMLLGSSTLYLTRIIHMPAAEVGLGLTVGAAAGLVAGPFVGHLADRRGPREVHIITMMCGALATAGFVVVRTFWVLALVSLLVTLVGTAGQASRAPLIRALASDGTTRYLSYQRAVTNVGVMVGILIATIGIEMDTGPVYVAIILASAATFLVSSAVLTRLPHVRPLEATSAHGRWVALTDRPYMTTTAMNGAMALHIAIPTFALPLWIVNDTSAPRAAVTGFVLVNGMLIVALQVRISRGIVDPEAAGLRMRWAGFALLAAAALIGTMAILPGWAALLVLLPATVVYTFGELWQAGAGFELAFGLAVPEAQGQYAGAFGLGQGAANAVGPAVLASLCLDHGLPGWLAFGALLMVVGLVTPRVVRWALSHRLAASPPSAEATACPPETRQSPGAGGHGT